MAVTLVELLPAGVKSEPLFKTQEEYERFRKSYIAEVCPILRKLDLARVRSEEEAMYRFVN